MDEEEIQMDDGVDTSLASEGNDLFVDLLTLLTCCLSRIIIYPDCENSQPESRHRKIY